MLIEGSGVRRTATRLADGRELIYYDDSEPFVSGRATRRLDDPRPLPDRFAPVRGEDGVERPFVGPELRYDVLTGDWVPMASHRMDRTFLPPKDANPLAPARAGAAYADGEIPAEDYDVVVFENRFPALMTVPGADDAPWHADGEELFTARPATGRCEVICFSPDPDASLKDVSPRRMRTIIEAWADRTSELGALPEVEQVYVFENRGKEIGVTLHHPHGQIYAFSYVTPRTREMIAQARAHRERTGQLLGRDVLEAELRAGTRVVAESEHWVAYVPFAARWPVEVHVAPRRDVVDLPSLDGPERDDLAHLYLDVLRRLDWFFADTAPGAEPEEVTLPYIAAWHQAPVREGREDLRLHLQVFSVLRARGRLKYLAGVESGMAAWISDTTPERIAARLKELAP